MFSIIICVYNNKKYLPFAVESVLSQSGSDYEIIIIDDGSDDGTEDIVDAYGEMYESVKVYHQKNQWIYASFNSGIKKARGEYIFILNSDDRLRENALSLLREKINKYEGLDVIWSQVVTNAFNIYSDTWIEKKNKKALSEELLLSSNLELAKNWVELTEKKVVTNQANLYRRVICNKIHFDNRWAGGDQIFNIEIAPLVNKSLVISDKIYDFMQYEDDNMNTSGKVYGYESEMFDYICIKQEELNNYWNEPSLQGFQYIRRLDALRMMISIIRNSFDKYDKTFLFNQMFTMITDYVEECFRVYPEKREEIEARILSNCREFFLKEGVDRNFKYYFVYEMLDSLLRYEKDEKDIKLIEEGVYNINNPGHIGETFYNQLCANFAYNK